MSDPLIGKKLGDYTIESLLGRGGMARVYYGYDENLDRYAAVKVIDAHLLAGDDRDEYYQRFQREARSIARLRHPNIVGIYQFGQVENDYYMAMVFIEGEDLRHILKKHQREGTRMSHARVLKIIRAMASALDYAHKEGVIYRDIKPSNILVTEEGNAVLTDFGLALNVPEGTIGNTFGSAHYIAPEQAVSSAQAVGQSDLYSLGICLYEMLTGRVPFDDASAMSVALKHLSDPPPPPSEIDSSISSEVEDVIMKVLEKEPEDRYETGEAFANALEQAFVLSHSNIEIADADSLPARSLGALETAEVVEVSVPSPVMDSRMRSSTGSRNPDLLERTSARLKNLESQSNERIWLLIASVVIALLVIGGGSFAMMRAINNTQDITPTAVAASNEETATQQTEEGFAPTVAITTEEASPSPTNSPEPTATLTPTDVPPTETPIPSITPTPIPTVLQNGFELIEIHYSPRTLVLFNASQETVDVSNLVFAQVNDNGEEIIFRSNRWASGASEPPSALPMQDCFQLWTYSYVNLPPEDYCDSRHGWRSVPVDEAFWIAQSESSRIFEVRRGEDVLATCEIAAEVCEVPVPLS